MSGSFCSLYREIHYILTLLLVKGACICSLFHEIHYIKIRYIEVWVYLLFNLCIILNPLLFLTQTITYHHFLLLRMFMEAQTLLSGRTCRSRI